MTIASWDDKQLLINVPMFYRTLWWRFLFFVLWLTYLPGLYVRLFGAHTAMRVTLQVMGLIDLTAMLMTLPLPWLLAFRSVVLQCCFIVSGSAWATVQVTQMV